MSQSIGAVLSAPALSWSCRYLGFGLAGVSDLVLPLSQIRSCRYLRSWTELGTWMHPKIWKCTNSLSLPSHLHLLPVEFLTTRHPYLLSTTSHSLHGYPLPVIFGYGSFGLLAKMQNCCGRLLCHHCCCPQGIQLISSASVKLNLFFCLQENAAELSISDQLSSIWISNCSSWSSWLTAPQIAFLCYLAHIKNVVIIIMFYFLM